MDYKKEYEDAIERCKKEFNFNNLAHPIIKQKLERVFPELKESEDERIRKTLKSFFDSEISDYGNVEWRNGIRYGEIVAWLEKQGEQKPDEKVESKFKAGDWVRAISSGNIFKILSVNDGLYRMLCYDGVEANYPIIEVEKDLAYWTIQDAKAGDVLADNYGIYIFEKFDECDKDCFVCNGAYQYSEKAYECGHMICDTGVHPATKAERDLLFTKMKEAGYDGDAEKKELKKIEQKTVVIIPKFHEGDVIKPKDRGHEPCKIMQVDIIEKKYRFKDGYVIHFSQEDDYELVEQKPAWSEEDEKIIDEAISLINMLASGYGEKVTEPITFNGVKMINNVKENLRNLHKKLNHLEAE